MQWLDALKRPYRPHVLLRVRMRTYPRHANSNRIGLRGRRNHAIATPDEHDDAGVEGDQHEACYEGVIELARSDGWQRVFVCSPKRSQLHQQRVAVVDGPERARVLPAVADDDDLRHEQ